MHNEARRFSAYGIALHLSAGCKTSLFGPVMPPPQDRSYRRLYSETGNLHRLQTPCKQWFLAVPERDRNIWKIELLIRKSSLNVELGGR